MWPAPFYGLAIEDVIAERGNPGQAPAGRDAAGVEEQRLADRRVMQFLVDDARDGDRVLPLQAACAGCLDRADAKEAEMLR